MSRYVLIVLIAIFAHPVFAETTTPLSETDANIFEFFSGVIGKQISVSIYKEEGRWIVEQHTIAEDGLPDLVDRKVFRSAEQAYAFSQSLGATKQNKNSQALDLPAPATEEPIFNIPGLLPAKAKGLWKAENEWSWEWEIKFAEWVRNNLHPDFFLEVGIENDCADAYYQSRMIFARIYKLPVSFRLAASGAWFTQDTLRPGWEKLKSNDDWKLDKRFLKALDYVADNTYTHTLGRDTYPVAITKEALIEGTAFLYLHDESGHTLLVNEINLNNVDENHKSRLPMYTLNSTIPKEVRPLYESFFFSNELPEKTTIGNTGFVRFRWPVSIGAKELVAADKMPFYSQEQYDPELLNSNPELPEDDPARTNFSLFVFKRLNPNFDPTLRITEGITLLKELLKARIDLVDRGYIACKNGCDPKGETYDTWSTPSRDGRIKELINDLESYQYNLSTIQTVVDAWNAGLQNNIVTLSGSNYPLSLVKWVWQNDLFSSDPNKIPGIRWGLDPESFAQASFEEINPALIARKAKIAASTKCQNCDLFSADFMKASTYLEDSEIITASTLRSEYCNNASPELCQRFEAKMASYPSFESTQSNFLDTWKNLSSLNSDPRVSEAARWGKIDISSQIIEWAGNWMISQDVSKNGLLLVYKTTEQSSDLSVVDTLTKKVLFTRTYPSITIWQMNHETSEVIGRSDNLKEMILINPLTGDEIQKFSFPLAENDYIYDVTWVDQDTLFMKTYTSAIISKRDPTTGQFGDIQVIKGEFTTLNSQLVAAADVNNFTSLDLLTLKKTALPIKGLFQGYTPNYISIEKATDSVAALNWSYYDSATNNSASGKIYVNFKTNSVLPINSNKFPNPITSGVTYTSNEVMTSFQFVDDDLKIVKNIDLNGYCDMCYTLGKYIQVGQTIYYINRENRTMDPLMELSSGYRMSMIINDLLLASYNNAEYTVSNAALISLIDGKTLLLAPNLNFIFPSTNEENSFDPLLQASRSITKTTDIGTVQEETHYYDFVSILNPNSVSAGSLSTSPSYYVGGDDCEDCGDHGMGMMAGLLPTPTLTAEDFSPLVMIPPTVKMIGKPVISETNNLSFLNLSDKKSVLIFNK